MLKKKATLDILGCLTSPQIPELLAKPTQKKTVVLMLQGNCEIILSSP